jgi:hypothetical protein
VLWEDRVSILYLFLHSYSLICWLLKILLLAQNVASKSRMLWDLVFLIWYTVLEFTWQCWGRTQEVLFRVVVVAGDVRNRYLLNAQRKELLLKFWTQLYKQPGPGFDHSPPSSAEVGAVKNGSSPPAVCLLSWHEMNLIFYYKSYQNMSSRCILHDM